MSTACTDSCNWAASFAAPFRARISRWRAGDQAGQRQPRRGRVEQAQLHAEAFGQAARADADRVEVLDEVQDRLDILERGDQIRLQGCLDVFKRNRQIAVLADRFDQCLPDQPVPATQVAQVQLPVQMFAKVQRRGLAFFALFPIEAAASRCAIIVPAEIG